MGLVVSRTHGVNPGLMQCFYCGEAYGVVLYGRLRGDEEAPRMTCLDRQPCPKCEGYMKQGIILVSVKDDDAKTDNQNPYRTGGWVVMAEKWVKRVVKPQALVDHMLTARFAFVPDEAWDLLKLPRAKHEPESV